MPFSKKEEKPKTYFDRKDYLWLLRVIKESCNLRGTDLEQAIITVQKVQSLLGE